MGEEVRMAEYDAGCGGSGSGDGDDERVLEWELGLPSSDDLTPLSQRLIPPELASAFSISPEPQRTMADVNRALENTVSGLRCQSNGLNSFKSFDGGERDEDESDPRKIRKIEAAEEAENADDVSKMLKRPRLVWTPQLHKRFVDVVAHLGIKNAVPKTIMQLMNVEGLTRENVASHLQKYRLYLKRMQGLSNEGPSSSDHLFASTPVPQNLNEPGGSGHIAMPVPVPIPMPYPQMMHVPMSHGAYPWMQQPREASGNYKFGSVGSHHHHQHPGSNDN